VLARCRDIFKALFGADPRFLSSEAFARRYYSVDGERPIPDWQPVPARAWMARWLPSTRLQFAMPGSGGAPSGWSRVVMRDQVGTAIRAPKE
jgi:hypothetical protein